MSIDSGLMTAFGSEYIASGRICVLLDDTLKATALPVNQGTPCQLTDPDVSVYPEHVSMQTDDLSSTAHWSIASRVTSGPYFARKRVSKRVRPETSILT